MTKRPPIDTVFATLAVVLPFCLYLLTLCRGIPIGDAPELALAAAKLQIAHPPGYPLLTIAGRIWSAALFFLRPVVSLNLLSAASAAVACGALYLLLARLVFKRGTAVCVVVLAIAVTFAASRTLWSTATNFEVYSLGALFTVLILLLLNRFILTGERRDYLLAAYLLGLSFCNHLSLLALLPALVIAAIGMRSILGVRTIFAAAILGVIPGTLYGYLVIRSRFDLVMSWYDPQRWTGFKQQVFAETYRRFVAAPNLADIGPYLHRLGNLFGSELVLPITLLALGGLIVQWRRNSRIAVMLGSVVLANCALNFNYTISDIAPYFLPSIIVLLIWLLELLAWLAGRSRTAAKITATVSIAIAAVAIAGNYNRSDLSDRTKSELYAKDLFESVPAGGMLFCGSDNSMFPALYLRYVEDYRNDCGVYGHLPTMSHLQRDVGYQFEGDWKNFPELLNHAIKSGTRPVVMARELMNFDNNFPRLRDNLIVRNLVYVADSAMQLPSRQHRVDFEEVPELYDPKEALMYVVYQLSAAESFAGEDAAEGERYYNRAVRIVNAMSEPSLSSALAAYFLDRNQHRQAIAVIQPALELPTLRREERQQLLGGLGTAQMRLQNTAAARTVFNQMLALEAGNIEAQFQLMTLDASEAVSGGDLVTAISIYQRMAQLAPDQHQVTMQLALLYIRTENYKSARLALQACIDADYQSIEARMLLGQIDSAGVR